MQACIAPLKGSQTPGTATVVLNAKGLQIFPVRYSIVPSDTASKPAQHLKEELGLKGHQYALRTLREGYLYVFYEQHADDPEHKWDVYSSDEDGLLRLININHLQNPEPPRLLLPSKAINIVNPKSQGKVYLAFSEHPWSVKTLTKMENDAALRDRRMQTLLPQNWVDSVYSSHGVVATKEHLESVLEYSNNYDDFGLISGDACKSISLAQKGEPVDGSYDKDHLQQYFTPYTLSMQQDDASQKLEKGLHPGKSKHNRPLMFALWDRVGNMRELNSHRNQPAGLLEQYQKQHAFEIDAMQTIDVFKQNLEKNTPLAVDQDLAELEARHRRRMRELISKNQFDTIIQNLGDPNVNRYDYPPGTTSRPLISAADRYINGVDMGNELVEVIRPGSDPLVQKKEAEIKRIMDKHKQARDKTASDRFAKNWDLYKDRLDLDRLKNFRDNYQQLMQKTQELIDQRTSDLVALLRSPQLQDALTEYDKETLLDGIAYTAVIADGIEGINSSPEGEALIKQWVAEYSVTDENLLWNAMALNNAEAKASFDTILAQVIASKKTPITSQSIFSLGTLKTVFDKLLDINSKVIGIITEEQERGLQRSCFAKIYTTVNLHFFAPAAKRSFDPLSDFIMESIFTTQHAIPYDKVVEKKHRELLKAETQLSIKRKEAKARVLYKKAQRDANEWFDIGETERTAKRIKYQREVMEQQSNLDSLLMEEDFLKKQHANTMLLLEGDYLAKVEADTQRLDQLQLDANSGKINELTSMRFGIITSLLQSYGLITAAATLDTSKPDSAMTAAKLTSDALALSGTVAELTGSFYLIKTGHPTNTTGLKLKFAGGALTALSGIIVTVLDFREGKKQFERGENTLGFAYRVKFAVNALLTGYGGVSALAAVNPIMQRTGSITVRLLANSAVELAGRRLFMMSFFWLGIASIALEVVIWLITDNDLQDWCERCAFSAVHKRRSKEELEKLPPRNRRSINAKEGRSIYPRFKNYKEQQENYLNAVIPAV